MAGDRTAEVTWRARRLADGPGRVETVSLVVGARDMTFGEVVEGWRDEAAFREFFLAELGLTPYPAFFWEMPPIARGAMDRRYEYVTVEGSALETPRADPAVFRAQLARLGAAKSVATFANLGGDADLVVPAPLAGRRAYGHLGAFLRAAPERQKHELLATLAQTIDARLKRQDGSIWVSTAGLGAPWLHVRLDARPKYYRHDPYRR
jgi:hypothetical protein